MKTPVLFDTDGYSLFVYHCSRNLYRISIMNDLHQTRCFEGIYPNLQAAISRGKSVIHNLQALQQNTTDPSKF